jgi:hypothetical protein
VSNSAAAPTAQKAHFSRLNGMRISHFDIGFSPIQKTLQSTLYHRVKGFAMRDWLWRLKSLPCEQTQNFESIVSNDCS